MSVSPLLCCPNRLAHYSDGYVVSGPLVCVDSCLDVGHTCFHFTSQVADVKQLQGTGVLLEHDLRFLNYSTVSATATVLAHTEKEEPSSVLFGVVVVCLCWL